MLMRIAVQLPELADFVPVLEDPADFIARDRHLFYPLLIHQIDELSEADLLRGAGAIGFDHRPK
jgi:hypothetical protein